MEGFMGVGPEEGTFVRIEDSYDFAMERCLHGTREEQEEFKNMLVEWFYSGNWIPAE